VAGAGRCDPSGDWIGAPIAAGSSAVNSVNRAREKYRELRPAFSLLSESVFPVIAKIVPCYFAGRILQNSP
jgi:hypothetical protein